MAFFWYTVVIPVLSANIIIGHEVVRLPVAHCELNPIEMAWSQVKGHVKRNNKRYINIVMDIVIVWHLFRFTLTEVKELVYQGFEAVTSERWQSLIKHVQEEVEDHYWEQDGLHEELLERFLIHVSSDSSDSEDGDGGDGGINDSSTTSNSESESSSEPTSSDVRLFDIYNTSVTTCMLFSRSHRMAGIELCKVHEKKQQMKCKCMHFQSYCYFIMLAEGEHTRHCVY